MAAKKKTDTKKKKQSNTKKSTKANKAQKQLSFVELYSKKIMLGYLAAFVLFAAITFIRGAGLWMTIRSGIFAFFGNSIYVLVCMLLVAVIILAIGNFKRKFIWHMLGSSLFIASIASLIQVFSTSKDLIEGSSFGELISSAATTAYEIPQNGMTFTGGIVGSLLGNGAQFALGKAPAILIYIILLVVAIILTFNISIGGIGDLVASTINSGKDKSEIIADRVKDKHEVNKTRRKDTRTARSEQKQIENKRKEIQRHKQAEMESARRKAQLEQLQKQREAQLKSDYIPVPEPLKNPYEGENFDTPTYKREKKGRVSSIFSKAKNEKKSPESEDTQTANQDVLTQSINSKIKLNPEAPSNQGGASQGFDFIRVTKSKPVYSQTNSRQSIVKDARNIGSGVRTPLNVRPVRLEDLPSGVSIHLPTDEVTTEPSQKDDNAFVPVGRRDSEGQIITGTNPEIIEHSDIVEEDEIQKTSEEQVETAAPKPAKKSHLYEKINVEEDKVAEEIIRNAAEENKRNELENRNQVAHYEDKPEYLIPPIDCLAEPVFASDLDSALEMKEISDKLIATLKSFGVETKMLGASRGPSVTRYELQPAMGVRINKITNLSDDIALNLATAGIRIEAPIPGKSAVGIEIPNKNRATVSLREIISSDVYKEGKAKSKLSVALGKDISGAVNCADLAKMPHMLVAGTTGSGKSVTMNCMIVSLLYNASPDDVKILLIDPKQVEFAVYNGIPHLYVPVISDARKASGALTWAVTEMERRYKLFSLYGVRDLKGYNRYVENHPEENLSKEPQSVIFIDELADLMMVSPKEVEDAICRLAQKARAAGMHLVVATQRPSVDVVTGLIKANVPSRLALSVSSQIDSRTIIDTAGAERLLGNGDMLFNPLGVSKPIRIQGAYVSDEEIERIVDFLKEKAVPDYNDKIMEEIDKYAQEAGSNGKKGGGVAIEEEEPSGGKLDARFDEVLKFACETGEISGSLIMRKFSFGYGRAAKVMDQMMERGYLGEINTSTKKRPVLLTIDKYWEMKQYEEASNGNKNVKAEPSEPSNPFDEPIQDDFDILSDD